VSFDVVIPTSGRPSLARLLEALARQRAGPFPGRVIVVEDARCRDRRAAMPPPGRARAGEGGVALEVMLAQAPGPAAARNVGWHSSSAEWVAFLDDDVIPDERWCEALDRDLRDQPDAVAASQGRVRVPLASDRRPTDWERNIAGLERARWATADMAYRRDVLARVGGFDERFRHAYREDADLGLRVTSLGLRIKRGERVVSHPPGPASFWTSVRLQRGNADDALMRRLHGRAWRDRAWAPRGRLRRHLLSCAATALAAGSALCSRPRLARLSALVGAVGVAELAAARIVPGPRDGGEIVRMAATSVALPFAAVGHRALGELRWRGVDA
jgi:glycosyltransferase involved in cell wall biosynthesis